MTILFTSGWENSGGTDVTDGGLWGSVSGTPTVTGSPVHSGNWALSCPTNTNEYVGKSGFSNTVFNTRFYVRLNAFPSNDSYETTTLVYLNPNGENVTIENRGDHMEWKLSAAGSNTYYNPVTPIAINKWYLGEIEYNADSDFVKLYIEDSLVVTNNGSLTAAITGFYLGSVSQTTTLSNLAFFDDIASADSYIGPLITTSKKNYGDGLSWLYY
jgi:hypothetical protein